MEVIRDMDWCPRPEQGSVVTVGAFDGVHRGHRAVIAEMHRMAAERGASTAVVTFDRHPASVVRPDSAPLVLTTLEQKLELLAETGVDYALVVTFDESRAKEEPEDFVSEVIVDCLRAVDVVVGLDFHFGHQRRGNIDLLRAAGAEAGFDVISMAIVANQSNGEGISSTAIRRALTDGDLATANRLLGRPFEVRGEVSVGDRRGRKLGFATANVPSPPELQLPADGVYAGWLIRADGTGHMSAINVGKRPTFYEDGQRSIIEAHLLDFQGDLYGELVAVRFALRLRDERKFDGVDAIVAQLADDVAETRRVLGRG